MHNNISKQLRLASEVLRQIQAVAPDIFRMQEQIRKLMQSPLLASITQHAEFVRRSFEVTRVAARSFQSPLLDYIRLMQPVMEIAKAMETAQEEFEEMERSDFPYSWLGSLPLSTIRHLYRLWKEGKDTGVREYLLKDLRDGKSHEYLLSKFSGRELMVPSLSMIRDALWAHAQGKWTLSIPAFMPQIEGTIRRMGLLGGVLEDLEHYRNKDGKIVEAKVGQVINWLQEKHRVFFGLFVSYLAEKFFKQHRNPILHGLEAEYASEELSAECILALNELANACEEMERREEAAWEQVAMTAFRNGIYDTL